MELNRTDYLDQVTSDSLTWLNEQHEQRKAETDKAEKALKQELKRKGPGASSGVQAKRPKARLIRPKAKPETVADPDNMPIGKAAHGRHNAKRALDPFYTEKRTGTVPTRNVNPATVERILPVGYEQRSKATPYQQIIGTVELNKRSKASVKADAAKAAQLELERQESELRAQAASLAKQAQEANERKGAKGYNAEKDTGEMFGPNGSYKPMTEKDIENGIKSISNLPTWMQGS